MVQTVVLDNLITNNIIAMIVGIISIFTSILVGVRWMVRHYLKDIIHELTPNSGSSMKDQIGRVEEDMLDLKNQHQIGQEQNKRVDEKIDHLTQMFIEYVARQK